MLVRMGLNPKHGRSIPKGSIRNSKQIQMTKFKMFQTNVSFRISDFDGLGKSPILVILNGVKDL